MNIQLHREMGLSIHDHQSQEALYQDSFENAMADASLEQLAWPHESILRVFSLADGRLAIVRETPDGLRQEAASPASQALYDQLTSKSELLLQKAAERKALEASADTISSDEA